MSEEALGKHIIIEYYDCDEEKLKSVPKIEQNMLEAAKRMNANIVESVFHQFSPWGVSGVVVIAESHLTIHTWPEYNYAAVDLFTCGEIDSWEGIEFLKEAIGSERYEYKEMVRGKIGVVIREKITMNQIN